MPQQGNPTANNNPNLNPRMRKTLLLALAAAFAPAAFDTYMQAPAFDGAEPENPYSTGFTFTYI